MQEVLAGIKNRSACQSKGGQRAGIRRSFWKRVRVRSRRASKRADSGLKSIDFSHSSRYVWRENHRVGRGNAILRRET
jgi:hypothetical protein